jgi:hypothetical protein
MERQRSRSQKMRDPVPVTWSTPAVRRRREWRYTLNVALAVGVAALLTVWFTLHFQPWISEALVVAGPLTLLALWKLVEPWVRRGAGDLPEQAVRRFLKRPSATEVLAFALLAAVTLLLTTSSIYVDYAGAPAGADRVRVQVLEGGHPFLPEAFEVTSYRRLAGRPFLLRTRTAALTFTLAEPPGYRPYPHEPDRPVRFRPWSAVRLRAPEQFDLDRFYLLRLVPGRGFIGELPVPGDQPSTAFSLWLREGDRGEEVLAAPDLRFQGLFVGAAKKDLKRLVPRLDAQKLHSRLVAYLAARGIPTERHAELLVPWETQALAGTRRFEPGAKIVVLVRQQGRQMPLFTCPPITVSGREDVQTEFLEAPPCVPG